MARFGALLAPRSLPLQAHPLASLLRRFAPRAPMSCRSTLALSQRTSPKASGNSRHFLALLCAPGVFCKHNGSSLSDSPAAKPADLHRSLSRMANLSRSFSANGFPKWKPSCSATVMFRTRWAPPPSVQLSWTSFCFVHQAPASNYTEQDDSRW